MPFIPGNEDCLFLNVHAPSNAQNLPVFVYIHGGGYGYGDASQDMTELLNANGNNFIAVGIQYRVGAPLDSPFSSMLWSRGMFAAFVLNGALWRSG